MARLVADPGLTALFGSYDDHPPARDVVSQFRNLLHHFVHQQAHLTAIPAQCTRSGRVAE